MSKHVFVIGLSTFHLNGFRSLVELDDLRVHPLLDLESIHAKPAHDFEELLSRARRELKEHDEVDAIVAHWDFPASLLAPILGHEHGIPAPSLRSLIACEHKYWSRCLQAEVVPESTPTFALFDPAATTSPEDIGLPFPFWVKPLKGHSSRLNFRVDDQESWTRAVEQLRDGVGRIADAFDQAMTHADLPDEIVSMSSRLCLAEELMQGTQVALEGSVVNGNIRIHGALDMPTDGSGSFDRFDYPSMLPADVLGRLSGLTERFLRHIEFDNSCFNIEFLWDEAADKVWLVEINTRISQSHSDLFAKVDGWSNHAIAVDTALGRQRILPKGEGPYDYATKIQVGSTDVGIVKEVPTEDQIVVLHEAFPDTEVRLMVVAGEDLRETVGREADRVILAEVYVGTNSRRDLERAYELCHELLPFHVHNQEQPV